MEKTIKFSPGLYYHEILKANSDGILFRDEEDRTHFLEKARTFILPCCEVLAYAVLGNHVHLLIRPHPVEILEKLPLQLHLLNLNLNAYELKDYLAQKFRIPLPEYALPYSGTVHSQIRYCIRGLKHSHDHYLKKKYETKGALWSREISTKHLPYPEDLTRTVLYIHKNPVFHGMVHQPEEWQSSSIHEILNGNGNLINRQDVINLFGSLDQFLDCHKATPEEFGRKPAKNKSRINQD